MLRSDQNIAGISNDEFFRATLRGLSAQGPPSTNVSTVSTVNEDNRQDNRQFNFNGIRDLSAARNQLLREEGIGAFS